MPREKHQKGNLPIDVCKTTSMTVKPQAVQAYRTQNTPPLQALVGIRVVASLPGHSRLDTLCSRANAQVGQWGHDLGKVARRPRQEHAEENAPSARKKGLDRSDPCREHETVPGWMRILWARATGLLAARWGINTG